MDSTPGSVEVATPAPTIESVMAAKAEELLERIKSRHRTFAYIRVEMDNDMAALACIEAFLAAR